MPSWGEAGRRLETEEAQLKFGRSATVGAMGERSFRYSLRNSPLRRYDTWYSLGIPQDPERPAAEPYRSDVDVALASGNRLVLVDVKRWAANQFYWSFWGKPMRGTKKLVKDDKWNLSANMAAAVDRYQANLPGVEVYGVVVFVATNREGTALPEVWALKWPGNIKSYTVEAGLERIQELLGVHSPAVAAIAQLCEEQVARA